MQVPFWQRWPIGQLMPKQRSGVHTPLTQRWPSGQTTPLHASTQLPLALQICAGGQVIMVHGVATQRLLGAQL